MCVACLRLRGQVEGTQFQIVSLSIGAGSAGSASASFSSLIALALCPPSYWFFAPAKHFSVRPAAFLNSFNQSCLNTTMTTLLGPRLGNLTSWITPCFPGETEQLEQSHRSQGPASSLRLRFSYWCLKLCKGVLCKMFNEVRYQIHKSIFTGLFQTGVECSIHPYHPHSTLDCYLS